MANKLHVYINNPTAGGTDGTAASDNGAQTNPIMASLVVDDNTDAEVAVKCALRCDSGYHTQGNTVLSFVDSQGTAVTSNYYKLATDNNYASSAAALTGASWSDTLTISTSIEDTNTVFWVKLSAAKGTSASNDTSVSLKREAITEAAT